VVRRCCTTSECAKWARDLKGKCSAHGGGRRCGEPGCTKGAAQGPACRCKQHGGSGRCPVPECKKASVNGVGNCSLHLGGRRCIEPGCMKGAASGPTSQCAKHGGSIRCQEPGCGRAAAENKTMKCKAHGGSYRCEEPGCDKSARGATTGRCAAHGGSEICSEPMCTTAARSSGGRCKKHKGSPMCAEPGCDTPATDGLSTCKRHGVRCVEPGCVTAPYQGGTHCTKHGGGYRCKNEDVHVLDYMPPTVYQADTSARLCHACYAWCFPDRFEWRLKREHFVLAEIQRMCDEWIKPHFVDWDCPIKGGCSLHRPDMLYDANIMWLAVEVDERGHDQAEGKYAVIYRTMAERPGLLIRINPDLRENKLFYEREGAGGVAGQKVWTATEAFEPYMRDVVVPLIEREFRDLLESNETPSWVGIKEIKQNFSP
jgi:hypothetical protein